MTNFSKQAGLGFLFTSSPFEAGLLGLILDLASKLCVD